MLLKATCIRFICLQPLVFEQRLPSAYVVYHRLPRLCFKHRLAFGLDSKNALDVQ